MPPALGMAIDQLLRKQFWIVLAPIVATVALLHAKTVTQLVGVSLAVDDKQLAAAAGGGKPALAPMASSRSRSAEPILSRNPFDHETGPLNKVEASDDGVADAVDLSDPMSAPPCEGTKVLVIIASPDPAWSMAALSTGGEGKSVLVRRGMEFGGKKVEYVRWDRVWLNAGSSRCQAQMWRPGAPEPTAAAPVAAAEPASSSRRGAPVVDADIKKGIQKISATEYNIDRGVVDKILENQAVLMKSARIVPEQENGKVVGIRLFGVRPDTLLGTLGMENGDRLQTINGFEMASPEKALEAYARLRTADKLAIVLNRKGQQMNLDYHIK